MRLSMSSLAKKKKKKEEYGQAARVVVVSIPLAIPVSISSRWSIAILALRRVYPSPPTPSVHPIHPRSPFFVRLCLRQSLLSLLSSLFLSLSLDFFFPSTFPSTFLPSPSSTRVLPASPRTDIKRRYVSAGKWTTLPRLFRIASLARTSVLGDDEGGVGAWMEF